MSRAVFKTYSIGQAYLIPPTWDEKIKPNHPVRVVNAIIEKLDLGQLYSSYQGGGRSSYDPKMLLKAIVYAYVNNVYSSRKIEEAIKSNIHFIWLCAGAEPDHNTINRFRSEKIEAYLKDVFKQIVLLLAEEGVLSLKDAYVDGTKIEANANRYSFVWAKSIKTNKERMARRLDELWRYSQELAAEELKDTAPIEFKTIDKEKITATIRAIEEAIKDKPITKEAKKNLNYIKKNYPKKIEEYDKKEKILAGGRSSFSRTDHDATFMRMKDDRLGNGQLKAAYNIQISTNNQMITNYGVYNLAGDTSLFIPHIKAFKALYGLYPDVIVADAGYGSDGNYDFLEEAKINHYVKYNYFNQERSGLRLKKHPFAAEHLHYDEASDTYICPMGQPMVNIGSFTRATDGRFDQRITRYAARNCDRCPMCGVCSKNGEDRTIEINHRLNRRKRKARENLTSPEGLRHSRRRSTDVETVFGNIKQNKNFRRFTLRGAKKVNLEFGLVAIAHNLKKYCR